jgi:hypothetical protein
MRSFLWDISPTAEFRLEFEFDRLGYGTSKRHCSWTLPAFPTRLKEFIEDESMIKMGANIKSKYLAHSCSAGVF